MIDRNEGHIVTVSSIAGKGGSPFLTDYWYVVFCLAFRRKNETKLLGYNRKRVIFQQPIDI